MSIIALLLLTMATFFASETFTCTIIAANSGQAMVNLKLWLSKSSSLHRQLHGGRGLNSQSLACESHPLPLGYHAKGRQKDNILTMLALHIEVTSLRGQILNAKLVSELIK